MLVTIYQGQWFSGAMIETVRVDPTRMAQGIMTASGFSVPLSSCVKVFLSGDYDSCFHLDNGRHRDSRPGSVSTVRLSL